MTVSTQPFVNRYKDRVTKPMLDYVAKVKPKCLHESLNYALKISGKRFRASLIYNIGDYFQADLIPLDYAAIAIEMVHTYSLIHDDLPAMDDDNLRRGLNTLHVEFNEAQAILTGDALQALAFNVLCDVPVNPEIKCKLIHSLAKASGADGLVAGQSLDVYASDNNITLDYDELLFMHKTKTGALIKSTVEMAAILCGASNKEYADLIKFSKLIGLAYQIHDDILDITVDTKTLRKTANKDLLHNKNTFCRIIGLENSKQYCNKLIAEAHEAIAWIPTKHVLHQITDHVITRNY